MRTRSWLQLFRAQTAPATILLLLVPYISGENSNLIGAIILAIFGLFVHCWSFGQNSLCDACTIHENGKLPPDMVDPSKYHHPLILGEISLRDAHNVIHFGLAILVTIAGVISFFGINPSISIFGLVIWIAYGWAYNMGLSKTTMWGFISICICFTGLSTWSWFLSHSELGQLGVLYLLFVFFTILFQISYSGHLKEIKQRERSNILIKMGAHVKEDFFYPAKARLYGIIVKVINLALAWIVLYVNFSVFALIMTFTLTVLAIVYLFRLTRPREYHRDKELRNMGMEEIATIYIPLPILLGWASLILMVVGAAYYFGMNKLLWREVYPKV